MQKFLIPGLLTGLIFMLSCNSRKDAWNNDVPAKTKTEIQSVNDSIIGSIAENNSQQLKHFFSDKLREQTGTNFDSIVSQMHGLIKSKSYSVLDECFVKIPADIKRDTIFKNDSGNHDYKINFDVETSEMYVSLLLHESEDGQLLITCIYGNYGGNWKISALRIGRYSYFGNTAIDIYDQAKTKYENGCVIDAANLISLVKQPLTPADQLFHYDKENDIKEFTRKVMNEADTIFRFPNLIGELKSEPMIYNIQPLPMKEGIFPVITYGTKVNVFDTIAVKRENDELQKIIGHLFPGIEKNNKYIFFRVYNAKSEIGHFEFVMHGTVNLP